MSGFTLQVEDVGDAVAQAARRAPQAVPLVVSLRDERAMTVGGLMASTYGESMTVQMVWLPEGLRRQGYGQRLLARAEVEGRRRGCRQASVECGTVHQGFFERCGYAVRAPLEDASPAVPLHLLVKRLG